MLNFKTNRVLKEEYSCPDLGKIVKEGDRVTFNVTLQVTTNTSFKNMQEVKEFVRNNKPRMQTIISRYCELFSKAKNPGAGGFEKKESKIMEAVLKRLGYLE